MMSRVVLMTKENRSSIFKLIQIFQSTKTKVPGDFLLPLRHSLVGQLQTQPLSDTAVSS